MSCFKNRLTIFILKILFSHVGLCFLVCGYMVGGAYLFIWLESGGERERYNETKTIAINITDHRDQLINEVIDYCSENNSSSWNESVEHIKSLLDAYQHSIIAARNYTQKWGRQAYRGTEPPGEFGWEVVSAVLFTATILTTVGYGHITPVTEQGYMVCVIYSVFAIPLMSMFLVNITDALLVGIRWSYHGGCCFFLERRRRREHAAADAEEASITTIFGPGRYRISPWNSGKRRGSAWQASAENGNDHRHESDDHRFKSGNLVPASLALIIWSLYLIGGAVLFQWWDDGWTMIESFYWVVVTLLTIGFGDIIPGLGHISTTRGKLQFGVVTVYIIAGMALSTAIARLVFTAVEEHTRKKRKLILERLAAKRAIRRQPTAQDLYEKDDKIDDISVTPITQY